MRGWIAAAVCAAGWAATCVESRRRWVEDGKALELAVAALDAAWRREPVAHNAQVLACAISDVNAALEARARRA